MGSIVNTSLPDLPGAISSMITFEGKIYAGIDSFVYRSNTALTAWELVIPLPPTSFDFGWLTYTMTFPYPLMVIYNGELYLGSSGSSDSLWKINLGRTAFNVVLPPSDNGEENLTPGINSFAVFEGDLYAAAGNYTGAIAMDRYGAFSRYTGVEIEWESIASGGNPYLDVKVVGLRLFTSTGNNLYRLNLTKDGFESPWGLAPSGLDLIYQIAEFNGIPYVFCSAYQGYYHSWFGDVWKLDPGTDTWSLVNNYFLGNGHLVTALFVYRSRLHVTYVSNWGGGTLSRLSLDESSWEDVAFDDTVSTTTAYCYVIFDSKLYITNNYFNRVRRYNAINTVNFDANVYNGLAPVSVNFTDISSGDYPITTWAWDFQDGQVSTLQNPFNTFIRGTYVITLTVSDGIDSGSAAKYNMIDSYDGGTYTVSNLNELQRIGTPGDYITSTPGYALHDNYNQTADIDAAATIGWNGGLGFRPIAWYPAPLGTYYNVFSGAYTGNNFAITNLHINRPLEDQVALIGNAENCNINNTNLINVSIVGQNVVASLISYRIGAMSDISTIDNCYASGTLTGMNMAGGLLGYVSYYNIINCATDVQMTVAPLPLNYYYAGGIAANVQNCEISNCNSTTNAAGVSYVGGITGNSGYTNFTNCHYVGTISCNYYAGGISGSHYIGNFIDCTAAGEIVINYGGYIGGLIGQGASDLVQDCHATMVLTDNVPIYGSLNYYGHGGLVGYMYANNYGQALIINCYAIGDLVGYQNVGGLVGALNGFNLENCYVIGNLTGRADQSYQSYFGVLVGYCSYATALNCHAIGNITITTSGYRFGGLFGSFSGNPTIIDQGIINCYYVGTISITGPSLYNDDVGGLGGELNCCRLANSYAIANINLGGYGDVGGLTAVAYGMAGSSSLIYQCFHYGNITNTEDMSYEIGGLIAHVYEFEVSRCYHIGDVTTTNSNRIGGLIGQISASYSNLNVHECFNIGNITAPTFAGGGLIGSCQVDVFNCFNHGAVTLSIQVGGTQAHIGGLVGQLSAIKSIVNCYNSGLVASIVPEVGQTAFVGGLIGSIV